MKSAVSADSQLNPYQYGSNTAHKQSSEIDDDEYAAEVYEEPSPQPIKAN